MDINTLRSVATVICFVMFIGIVWWAYRGKNAERFHEAAMLPFALDEAEEIQHAATKKKTKTEAGEGAQP